MAGCIASWRDARLRCDTFPQVTFYNTAESYSERKLPSTPFYYVDVQHSGQIGMELKTSPTGMGAITSGVVPGSQLDRAGVVRPGHVLVSVAGVTDVAPPPTPSGAHFGCSL